MYHILKKLEKKCNFPLKNTIFAPFPQGSETVSAGFRRLFHRVHGCLVFPSPRLEDHSANQEALEVSLQGSWMLCTPSLVEYCNFLNLYRRYVLRGMQNAEIRELQRWRYESFFNIFSLSNIFRWCKPSFIFHEHSL